MIERAAYGETRQDAHGVTVHVKRGQFLTTYRALATLFKWDKNAVQRFLERLVADQMIGLDKTSDKAGAKTLITIRNYDAHQIRDDASSAETVGQPPSQNRDKSRDSSRDSFKPQEQRLNITHGTAAGTGLGTEPGQLRDTKETREIKEESERRSRDAGATPLPAVQTDLLPTGEVVRFPAPTPLGPATTTPSAGPIVTPEARAIVSWHPEAVQAAYGSEHEPIFPRVEDVVLAARWLAAAAGLGLDPSTVVPVIQAKMSEICQKMRRLNRRAPRALSFYQADVLDLLTSITQPVPEVRRGEGARPGAKPSADRHYSAARALQNRSIPEF